MMNMRCTRRVPRLTRDDRTGRGIVLRQMTTAVASIQKPTHIGRKPVVRAPNALATLRTMAARTGDTTSSMPTPRARRVVTSFRPADRHTNSAPTSGIANTRSVPPTMASACESGCVVAAASENSRGGVSGYAMPSSDTPSTVAARSSALLSTPSCDTSSMVEDIISPHEV